MAGPANNAGEDSTGGIVSSKTGLQCIKTCVREELQVHAGPLHVCCGGRQSSSLKRTLPARGQPRTHLHHTGAVVAHECGNRSIILDCHCSGPVRRSSVSAGAHKGQEGQLMHSAVEVRLLLKVL